MKLVSDGNGGFPLRMMNLVLEMVDLVLEMVDLSLEMVESVSWFLMEEEEDDLIELMLMND